MAVPSVTDLKVHLNMTGTSDDDELTDVLDSALDIVTGLIGPIAEPAAIVETHYGLSSDVLVLRRMPVAELTTVATRVGAATTAQTLADYELDPATGIVRAANGARFYGNYTITYTSGRDTLPASIRLAVLIIAAHLWETQRLPGFTSRDSLPAGFGGVDGIPDATGPVGMGFAIPSRAQELLQPYMRPVIA